MTACVIVDILINAQQQQFIKAAVFVMELHQLIFLDTESSCKRPKLSPPGCWLLKVSRQREITFKGLRTYYRAVSGAAGGYWWLYRSVTLPKPEAFKDKNQSQRSEVDQLTQPTSDRNTYLSLAAPWTDSVVTLFSPAATIRPKQIRSESRKSCFPPLKNPDLEVLIVGRFHRWPEQLLQLPPTQLKRHPVWLATAVWPL